MIDTVLYLRHLNSDMAVFMGDAVEEREVNTPFGEHTQTPRFPCFELSLDMWEMENRPVVLRVQAYPA